MIRNHFVGKSCTFHQNTKNDDFMKIWNHVTTYETPCTWKNLSVKKWFLGHFEQKIDPHCPPLPTFKIVVGTNFVGVED